MTARQLSVLAISSALLSSCAVAPKETITSTNIDYNVAFEKSQNGAVLLNILRASDRKPMYFTAMNAMRGNLQASVSTGSITIPFGPGDTVGRDKFSVAPTATFGINPTFDVAILDTKAFWTGILSPISLATFKYYWEQGWPQDLLLNVFVKSIEDGNSVIENYPGDTNRLEEFRKKIRALFNCIADTKYSPQRIHCSLQVAPDESEAIGAPLSRDVARDLKSLIEAEKANLKVEPYPGCEGVYRLVSKKKSLHIKGPSQIKAEEVSRSKPKPIECTHLLDEKKVAALNADQRKSNEACIGTTTESGCITKIYLRSPQAMLYYLGEVVRAEINPDLGNRRTIGIQHCHGIEAPLFKIEKGTDSRSIASVEYEGDSYVIRKDENKDLCSRAVSSSTLTLVLQILAQLKESSDLPVTGAVNVVGSPLVPR